MPAKPAPPNASIGLREAFAKLLEDPSRDKLHELLRSSGGEFRDLDFKEEWPAKPAVAKQILGLGNIGGGVLVIGVREETDGSLIPVGVSTFTDKATITGWIKAILPSSLLNSVTVHDFDYPTGEYGVVQGKKFQVMFVQPDSRHIPFLALKEAEKISAGIIYVRREGMVDAASHEEVQRILNRRIEEGHSTQPELDLQGHLDQLRVLYGAIEKTKATGLGWMAKGLASTSLMKALGAVYESNPLYPTESLEEFVASQIGAKKKLIQKVLGTLDGPHL